MSSPVTPYSAFRAWLEAAFLRRAALLVGWFILAVYAGMAADELAFDNAFILKQDSRLRVFSAESLVQIFQHDYWWGSMASNLYRPLTTVMFWFEYSFLGYGAAPLGYQIANALFHWGNAILVCWLARRLRAGEVGAVLAGLLYAIHPVNTEAVANIVGRSDLLATTGMLSGLCLYFLALEQTNPGPRNRFLWLMGVCGFVGMMAKESAIVLPAIVAWHGILRLTEWKEGGERRRLWVSDAWRAAVALMPMAIFFVVTREYFSRFAGVTDHPFIDNPLVREGFLVARISALGVWGQQLAALLLPLNLSNDYSFNAIPAALLPLGNSTAIWGWATLALFAGAGWGAWRLRMVWPTGIFCLGAYVIAMLPTSNMIIQIGSIRADRFHYLPSGLLWIGVVAFSCSVLVPWFRSRRAEGLPQVVWVPVLGWALCLAVLAHFRCYDWRSNLALWSSALVAQPNSAKVLAASGNARVLAHQNDENEEAAVRGNLAAVAMFKNSDVPMYHWPMQSYSDLIASYLSIYDTAITRGEKEAVAHKWLDQALKVHSEAMEVEAAVKKRWVEKFGDEQTDTLPFLDILHRNYAVVLSRMGRVSEAEAALGKVIEVLPLKANNYGVLAEIQSAAGKFEAALDEFIFARVMDPENSADLSKIAAVAKKISPSCVPLISDGTGVMKLNLDDPLIQRATRAGLLRYKKLLLRSGLTLDALRVDRVARYHYGITEPLSEWK